MEEELCLLLLQWKITPLVQNYQFRPVNGLQQFLQVAAPACVLRAVDLGRDTDTTAAVAGALAGLWYGSKQIPAVWELKTAKYEEIKERTKRFYAACTNTQCE